MLARKSMQNGLRRWLLPLAALVWFCGAFFAINWVGESKFTDFDPQLRLSSEMMSLSMEGDLLDVLSNQPEIIMQSAVIQNAVIKSGVMQSSSNTDVSNGKILHITQGDCFCETLSESHQITLNQWATSQKIAYQSVNIANVPGLSRFVPSTPAVIVLNKSNELVYLGPYSSGMGCFQDSGIVDARIKPYFQNASTAFNATIQSEAKGCYCATQPLDWQA